MPLFSLFSIADGVSFLVGLDCRGDMASMRQCCWIIPTVSRERCATPSMLSALGYTVRDRALCN